jgi:hypothetical protein
MPSILPGSAKSNQSASSISQKKAVPVKTVVSARAKRGLKRLKNVAPRAATWAESLRKL